MPSPDVEMTVCDVFVISGRGIVASGEAVRGEFRSGDVAQIWRAQELLATSTAFVELHVRPGTVAVLLTGPDAARVRPGDLIRNTPR